MALNMDEIAADVEAAAVPSDGKLEGLALLGEEYERLLGEINDIELMLENRRGDLHRLRTEVIPVAMDEIGMVKFSLRSGREISVDTVYTASIPAASTAAKSADEAKRRSECFGWLEENGFGDLIKHEVSVSFGRGEGEEVATLKSEIAKLGLEAKDVVKVEPSTLGAFAKEQGKAGNELPEIFKPFVGQVATIVDPNARRRKRG